MAESMVDDLGMDLSEVFRRSAVVLQQEDEVLQQRPRLLLG